MVVIVGFVDARKRQAEFLEALAAQPNSRIHVAIVGPSKDEAEWNRCHKVVRQNNMSVTFHGYQSDVRPWYRAADVVALPSSAEGVPRAILEGAAACLPAVAFDIPGCREAIVNGRTGLLVASMSDMVAAVSKLAASPEQRQLMGTAGRSHILACFEASRNVKRLEDLYLEME